MQFAPSSGRKLHNPKTLFLAASKLCHIMRHYATASDF